MKHDWRVFGACIFQTRLSTRVAEDRSQSHRLNVLTAIHAKISVTVRIRIAASGLQNNHTGKKPD